MRTRTGTREPCHALPWPLGRAARFSPALESPGNVKLIKAGKLHKNKEIPHLWKEAGVFGIDQAGKLRLT